MGGQKEHIGGYAFKTVYNTGEKKKGSGLLWGFFVLFCLFSGSVPARVCSFSLEDWVRKLPIFLWLVVEGAPGLDFLTANADQ